MTDDQRPDDPRPDDVGSVGEEAMRLLGAFADLARQHTGDAAHEVGEHLATDAVECKYCPVCRVVHAVRQTSPEVKAHLMVAASSLLQAAASLMETPQEGTTRASEVQRIDLDDPEEPAP
ncbi:hypothetical protein [Nocardioides humi]|uniref:Alkylhydroperoxidase AhpD family core domain-containing protein n=1 Tax=Nocardioides humi TaxID=449461 RepID=A0ABN2APJ1_9ACTN|nr:hypothetical protein [Nocardioides humi]